MRDDDVATVRGAVIGLARRLRAERGPNPLSPNKVGILGRLARGGPMAAGELAEAEHQRPQSLTRVFAELELAGLIRRAPAEYDRRVSVLALTARGRAALAADLGRRDAWLASAMADLSSDERATLRAAAALLDRIAEHAGVTSRGRMSEPGWVEHAIWWQVFPLGFLGADPTGADRRPGRPLTALADWLDYAVTLGVNGLQLGPIFASSTHGYDTIDHRRIDPRLGTDDDFDVLARAASERGVRLLLDGVFNHVGPDFAGDPASLRRDEHGAIATFEGHSGLLALDHALPAVADYVVDVMVHWLDRGAAGWRLDAAYAVPHDFWTRVLPRVRARHPDAYVVGEVIHGDYPQIVRDSTLDSVTQYELWKAIWSGLNDRNFYELAWALDRHNACLDTFVPLTFTGNHDVTRLASRLVDDRHLAHALVVLFTVGGTPSVYYGDEQAFRGVKEERVGGDDEIRPAFPAAPADLAPDGAGIYRLHQDLIGLRRRNPWLHRARVERISVRNEQFVYRVGELVVALNLADTSLPQQAGELLLGSPGASVSDIPPHGWAILRRP